MKEKRLVQSVQRAIEILQCFSAKEDRLGVTEISRRLDLNKSTVFGIISTLEHYRLMEKVPETGQYKLGIKLLELGNLVFQQLDLRKIARPYLDQIVEEFKETTHLAILDGYEVVYVDKVDSDFSIRMNSEVGKRRPAYCTGLGKAILSYLPGDEWKEHLPPVLKRVTPNTITGVDDLEKEVERIRRSGYAEDNEEIEQGLRCVAVPIWDQDNNVIAAISVSGPTVRVTKEKAGNIVVRLLNIAGEISGRMGGTLQHKQVVNEK
ncbi:MAG: IclR family transcriptional regulator [Desulfitobacteriaceae bacterium]